MKKVKKCARLSEQEDTKPIPATFKSVPAVILSGISCLMLLLCYVGGVFTTMDRQRHDGIKWDLVIAHPPCTYLSNAGACRLYPHKGELDKDRYINGLKGKEFFMMFYWYGMFGGRIAIENPIPTSIYELPRYSQVIQPYEYGHPYTKKTCLWLFGLPPLMPEEMVAPIGPYCPSGTGRKDRSKYGSAKRGEDAKNRSKTFPGIAQAMAEQWGREIA